MGKGTDRFSSPADKLLVFGTRPHIVPERCMSRLRSRIDLPRMLLQMIAVLPARDTKQTNKHYLEVDVCGYPSISI